MTEEVNISMQERAGKVVHLAFRAGAKRTLALLEWLPVEQRADLVDLLLSKPAVSLRRTARYVS